jgi:hypothetical protein
MNIASDKVDKNVGDIYVNKTSETEFLVQVPKGVRHEVFLMIWEDGRVILKGTGSFMVETNVGTAQEFRTTEIIGSRNDTDYDGIPDAWETYYGLDPSDASDANEDKDGDGITNRGEYLGGSEPSVPQYIVEDGEDDESDYGPGIAIIGISLMLVIIIIIAAIRSILKPRRINQDQRPSSVTAKPEVIHQTTYRQQTGPVTCIKCGGMIQNLRCQHCGMDYYKNEKNNEN